MKVYMIQYEDDLSHNEVLLSMDIVNLIKERVFDDNDRD